MAIVERTLSGRFGDMVALENEPPVTWLIPGWLAARELSCIYGQGGTFKSYIALGWTLQIALAGKTTLYIAAEGTSGLKSRVDAWMTARAPKHDILSHWHYYNANIHLDDQARTSFWLDELLKYLKDVRNNPKLIVVDTMARNFQGDENSAKEVGMFIEGCEYLRRETGAAILVIHHMGVSTGRERGTAALRNATFAMFQTQGPKHNGKGGGSVVLKCDRMKDAAMPDDVRCYFDTVALDVNEQGDVYQRSQAMRTFPPRAGEKPRKTVIRQEK